MTQTWRGAAIIAARLCGKTVSRYSYCGRRATQHVMHYDGTAQLVCPDHSISWGWQRYKDRHPIGGECGPPGTQWVNSTGGQPGRCIILGLDMPDLFATDAELGQQVLA